MSHKEKVRPRTSFETDKKGESFSVGNKLFEKMNEPKRRAVARTEGQSNNEQRA